jgi:hypothetical protein
MKLKKHKIQSLYKCNHANYDRINLGYSMKITT